MERHLNVSALGMRVSLIKPELPSLHIHSKRDRRAGRGGGGKVFKCRREVPGCRHVAKGVCGGGGGRRDLVKETEGRRETLSSKISGDWFSLTKQHTNAAISQAQRAQDGGFEDAFSQNK